MKARTLFHALCELGTLWLKSDADPDDEPDVDEGDPEPEMIDKQGIRIESILGETKILSDKKMHIGTTGDDDGDEGEDKAALILTSNAGAVKIVSTAKDVLLKTAKKLFLSVAEEVMASCSKWIGSGKYWSFGNAVKITGTTVNAQEVNSYFLRAKSLIAGPKSYAQTLPNDTGMPPLKQHLNHVAEVDEDLEVDLDVDLIDPAPSKVDTNPGKALWNFWPREEYVFSDQDADKLYEPHANQSARLEEERLPEGEYEDWEGAADSLLEASGSTGGSTGTRKPWPGDNANWMSGDPEGDELGKPTEKAPSEMEQKAGKLSVKPVLFKYRKRESS